MTKTVEQLQAEMRQLTFERDFQDKREHQERINELEKELQQQRIFNVERFI